MKIYVTMGKRLVPRWLFLSILIIMAVFNSVTSMSVRPKHANIVHSSSDSDVFRSSQPEKRVTRDVNSHNVFKRSNGSHWYDFGLSRGSTGARYSKYLLGKHLANDIYGPGRKR